jgi:hypothetical protein
MRIARGVAILMALLAGAAVWQAVVANQQRNEAVTQRGIAEQQTAEAQRQEGIANDQRIIAENQTVEARRQEQIATEQRDEAVRQRDLALARRLVSDSSRQLVNPQQWNLAMLLAIESMRKTPTADNYELLARLMRDGAHVVASFPGSREVVFSRDGRLVATRANEQLVVREARGGRERARIDADAIAFAHICFTPSGDRVIGYSDEAVLADITARRRLRLPIEIARGSVLSTSPDCRLIAVAHDGVGRLIELEQNSLVAEFPVPPTHKSLTTANSGDAVAYAEGARATIVNPRTKTVRSQWQGDGDISWTSFDAEGKRLTVVAAKGMAMLDVDTGRPVATSDARGVPSPRGEFSASVENGGRELMLWSVPRGVFTGTVPLPATPTTIEWSDDGEFVALGGGESDGAARVLQSESWRQLARFAFSFSSDTLMRTPQLFVHVSPSGNLAAASDSNRAVVFEIHQDRPVVTLPSDVSPGPVALSGDGRRAAFRSLNRKVVVLDTASGRELASLDCTPTALRPPVKLNTTGRVLAVNCGGTAVVVYDVDTRRQITSLPVAFTGAMALSRDGAFVFAGSALARSSSGQIVRKVGEGRAAALDPTGGWIALADQSEVRVIDLRAAASPRRIDTAIQTLNSVAFSDDGGMVAAGGRDMRVKIFETATGRLVQLLEHIEQDQWVFNIHRLAFSASGRLIATLADDPTKTDIGRPGTARVFDVATGREVARVPFPELAHEVRFTPDDSALEIAVGRRRIRWERYPLAASAMIEKACTVVQRNMEPLEWARFMSPEPRRDSCALAAR